MAGRDGVAVEVQFAVDLDEGHRALVAGEHGERSRAQVFAVERVCVAGDRWDRWRSAPVGDAVALDDVLGIDAGPHDDADLGQSGAYLGELDGEGALRVVECGRLVEQLGALAVEGGEFARPVRQSPVAGGIFNGRHASSPGFVCHLGEARLAAPNVNTGAPTTPPAP